MSTVFADEAGTVWRFSVGPAYRSRVKTSLTGTQSVTPISPSHTVTYDKDVAGVASWDINDGSIVEVKDPSQYASPGDVLYAVQVHRTETTITPGESAVGFGRNDEDSSCGMKLGVGYDFYDNEIFSIGLDFKFAAYWDMESEVSRLVNGGTARVHTMSDYFLFSSGPIPPASSLSSFLPETTPYIPYRETISDTIIGLPSSKIRAMVTSDLYQIGIGPRLGWRLGDWFDAYAGASVLCNIMSVDFAVGGQGESAIECSFGAGAEIGLVAWLGDNFGIYAEAGYEWIDAAKVRNGGVSAEMDYSSLIVSAGCIFRF